MAFGVGRAAAERNLVIPRDVSLIGFDDVDLAQVVSPPLTTIHAPKYEIGQLAVEMLLKEVKRGTGRPPEQRTLGVELKVRKSCGPPRRARLLTAV